VPIEGESTVIVADTSVLINFLKIDRMDLIGCHPDSFLVIDHVQDEILSDYPQQLDCFNVACDSGYIKIESVIDPAELELFARLAVGNRLGAGERAAIAVALHRGYTLAIDDRKALNRALREAGTALTTLQVVQTQDIVVKLIRQGVLALDAADAILDDWAKHHRFKLKISSFSELL
jgi:predicted nucleic acid-binding protein